nr:hypothetical protein [Bacilli bacterium]
MTALEVLSYIENVPIVLNNNYYYHAFVYDHDDFVNMINKGIKAPIYLNRSGDGYNGLFYVSLSKNLGCKDSIYEELNSLPMFIINEKIFTFKTKNGLPPSFSLMKSPLPIRYSDYEDEYQKFLKVKPKDILGIQFNLFSNVDDSNIRYSMAILQSIINDLENENSNMPIIDGVTSRMINKNKVMSLNLKNIGSKE